MFTRSVRERFFDKVSPEPNSGCWLWDATGDEKGYGFLKIGNRHHRAHRVSYQLHKGPIPKGMVVDHLCSVRCCVNPDHLEAVSHRENAVGS